MDKIEQFIEKQNKIILEDREKTLISLGLTKKEYSPDNFKSWKYPECEYINGEKRYYGYAAIQVTDEEYELILSKAKQVEAIRAKNEQEQQKEESMKSPKMIKKWIPASVWEPNNESKISSALRIVAWLISILTFILIIVFAFKTESVIYPLIIFSIGMLEVITLCAFAVILDYLSELTFIVRNGFKYTETK